MTADRIVAVGFLTQRDVSLLGKGFNRLFPVSDDAQFADLLNKLDGVAPTLDLEKPIEAGEILPRR